jgi:hypothetical protein
MVLPQGTNKLSDRLKIHTKDAPSISNKDQAIMETCAEINTIPKTSINERLKLKDKATKQASNENVNVDMTNDGHDNNTENEEKNTQIKQDNQIIENQTPESKIQIASTFDVQPKTFTKQLENLQPSKTSADQESSDWDNESQSKGSQSSKTVTDQQTTNWLNEIKEDKKEKNKKGTKTNKNYNKDINERKKEMQRENF